MPAFRSKRPIPSNVAKKKDIALQRRFKELTKAVDLANSFLETTKSEIESQACQQKEYSKLREMYRQELQNEELLRDEEMLVLEGTCQDKLSEFQSLLQCVENQNAELNGQIEEEMSKRHALDEFTNDALREAEQRYKRTLTLGTAAMAYVKCQLQKTENSIVSVFEEAETFLIL